MAWHLQDKPNFLVGGYFLKKSPRMHSAGQTPHLIWAEPDDSLGRLT